MALIVCLFVLYYYIFSIRDRLVPFIVNYINSQVNGELKVKNLKWSFSNNRVGFKGDTLELNDSHGLTIVKLNDYEILFKWTGIFTQFKSLRKIHAEETIINITRDTSGHWNLEDLFKKKSTKKINFSIEELDLPQTQLHITDYYNKQALYYEELKAYWKKSRFKKNYFIDVISHQNVDELDELKATRDFFELKGYFTLNALNRFYRRKNLGKLTLQNFYLEDFQFLIPVDSLIKGVNGSLNANFSFENAQEREINMLSDLIIADFELLFNDSSYKFSESKFISDINISEEITLNSFEFILDKLKLNLSGTVNDWRDFKKLKNAELNLKLSTQALDLKYLYSLIPEIVKNDSIFQKLKIDQIITTIQNSFIVDLLIEKTIANPKLSGTFEDSNTSRKIEFNILSDKDSIEVEKLSIPIDTSMLEINGQIDKNLKNFFDITVKSVKLPLDKLRKFVLLIPLKSEIQDLLTRARIFGNLTTDLKIKKPKNKNLDFTGKAKLEQASFFSVDYPVPIRSALADIEIKGPQLTINDLHGYIKNDYFESSGSMLLREKKVPLMDLAINASNISLANVIGLNTFELLKLGESPQLVNGALQNLNFKITNNKKKNFYNGNFDLNNLAFQRTKHSPLVHSLNGSINVFDNGIEFKGLSFNINNSNLTMRGKILDDKPELNINAKALNFKDFFTLINESRAEAYQHTFKKIDLSKINNFNAKVAVNEEELHFEESSMNYGASAISFGGLIKNYQKLEDMILDLALEADLNATDINSFMTDKFRKYLSLAGSAPVEATLKGTKTKMLIETSVKAHKFDKLAFSNWLLLKSPEAEPIRVKAESKITITPHSIFSDQTKIFVRRGGSENLENSQINSSFKLDDWSSNLNFQVSFDTPDPQTAVNIIEPHIISIKDLKLTGTVGNFHCDTFGSKIGSQTLCRINIEDATAPKFNIGDLNGKDIAIDLLALTNEPVRLLFDVKQGDWNAIPFKNLKFDMDVIGDDITVTDLVADIKDGKAWADYKYNYKTFESEFDVKGQNLPANELTEGVWALGSEVPEGLVAGTFTGSTKGILPEEVFMNMKAQANVIVKDGKLSKLNSMQRLLNLVNSLTNFDLNNVMQTLISYEGGKFDYIISSLDYDLGRVSSKKLLLKSPQIEILTKGHVDYRKDFLSISGKGLIPKHSKSILQKVGLGEVNLGNAISIFSMGAKNQKRFFQFSVDAPVSQPESVVESLRQNFTWVE